MYLQSEMSFVRSIRLKIHIKKVQKYERKIMEEIHKSKKNHWTSNKVDEATKKINNEIYKRNRQAPIHIKLDDLSVFINSRITRRGCHLFQKLY